MCLTKQIPQKSRKNSDWIKFSFKNSKQKFLCFQMHETHSELECDPIIEQKKPPNFNHSINVYVYVCNLFIQIFGKRSQHTAFYQGLHINLPLTATFMQIYKCLFGDTFANFLSWNKIRKLKNYTAPRETRRVLLFFQRPKPCSKTSLRKDTDTESHQ